MYRDYSRQSWSKEVRLNRRRLLLIWRRRPAATDTMENIARKWLGQFDCNCVQEALAELLDEGIIQKWSSDGHTFFYARNYYEIKHQAL